MTRLESKFAEIETTAEGKDFLRAIYEKWARRLRI